MNPNSTLKIVLETERLILREFVFDDAHFIIELLNSEAWLKYIGDRRVKTLAQAKNYLKNGPLKSYATFGFGLNAAALQSGELIGMCGLLKRDYLEHPDIGFAFLPQHGKKGYAYEIAKATVEYAFKELQQKKIAAITVPENKNSIQLLQKIGFRFEKNIIQEDAKEELMLFEIERHELH